MSRGPARHLVRRDKLLDEVPRLFAKHFHDRRTKIAVTVAPAPVRLCNDIQNADVAHERLHRARVEIRSRRESPGRSLLFPDIAQTIEFGAVEFKCGVEAERLVLD